MTKEYFSKRKEIITEENMDHWEERTVKWIKIRETIIDYPSLEVLKLCLIVVAKIMTSSVIPCVFNNICSTTRVTTFCFFAALSTLLISSLFWLSIFMKCYMGLSLRDEEAI